MRRMKKVTAKELMDDQRKRYIRLKQKEQVLAELEQALPEAIVEQGLYNIAYAAVFVVLFFVVIFALRLLIRAVDTVLPGQLPVC